jgi:hypothetical protein
MHVIARDTPRHIEASSAFRPRNLFDGPFTVASIQLTHHVLFPPSAQTDMRIMSVTVFNRCEATRQNPQTELPAAYPSTIEAIELDRQGLANRR